MIKTLLYISAFLMVFNENRNLDAGMKVGKSGGKSGVKGGKSGVKGGKTGGGGGY